MAALAYVLLPLSGLLAYSMGRTPRIRRHGAQAVLFGLVWPLALFGASNAGAGATRATFVLGALAWVVIVIGTAVGKDPLLPGIARLVPGDGAVLHQDR